MTYITETDPLIQRMHISKSLVSIDNYDRPSSRVVNLLSKVSRGLEVHTVTFDGENSDNLYFMDVLESRRERRFGIKNFYGEGWWISTSKTLTDTMLKIASGTLNTQTLNKNYNKIQDLRQHLSYLYRNMYDRSLLSIVKDYQYIRARIVNIDIEEVVIKYPYFIDNLSTTSSSSLNYRPDITYRVRSLVFDTLEGASRDLVVYPQDYAKSWFIID